MGIQAKIKPNQVRAMLAAIIMAAAICVAPITVMAEEDYNYPPGYDYGLIDILAADGMFMVLFEPFPGYFPEGYPQDAVRFVRRDNNLYRVDFPPDPVRDGYVFDGWRVRDVGQRVDGYYFTPTVVQTTLEAIWVPYGGETASTPTPTPDPGATPTPTPPPEATPAPGASPTPTPHSAPQPNPPHNPSTNPITISFMIFGAVATLGIAAYGVINLYLRHNMAIGKYQAQAARNKRESRLVELLEEDEIL